MQSIADKEEAKQTKTKSSLSKSLSKKKWFTIFLSALTVLVLAYVCLLFLLNRRSGELSYTLSENIDKIKIDLPVAQLHLLAWEKDYVKVSFEFFKKNSSKKQLKASEKEEVWQFNWDKSFMLSDWQVKQLPNFKIYVPQKRIKQVDFKVNYGLVELGNFKDLTINGFLNAGNLTVNEQVLCEGSCQVCWGNIYVSSPVIELTWLKSTGFSAFLQTGQNRLLKLITYMGKISSEELIKK